MVAISKELSGRVRSWPASALPPDEYRDYAWQLDDNHLAFTGSGAGVLSDGIDEKRMSFPAIITTIGIDRLGDQVVPEGVSLEGYKNSPVWFFGHQLLPFPIGKSKDDEGNLHVFVEPGKLIHARCFCYQKQTKWGEQVEDIFQMIVDGVLSGISIGFDPDPDRRFTKRLPSGGHRFERWSLLENSVVGVGCNKDALALHGKSHRFKLTDAEQRSGEIVRSYLSRGRIAGKRIDPLIRKAIMPLAVPKIVQLGWEPRTEANVAKKIKPAPMPFSRTALQRMKAAQVKRKGMMESGGTQGGYTVPTDDETKCGLSAVMNGMGDGAKGHSIHYSKTDGYVHHAYPVGADAESLEKMRTACIGVKGVSEVYQSADGDGSPQGDGWQKVYPVHQDDMDGDDMEMEDMDSDDMETRSAHECKCGGCDGCQAKSMRIAQVLTKYVPAKLLAWVKRGKTKEMPSAPPPTPAPAQGAPVDEGQASMDDETALDDTDAEGETTPHGAKCLQALIEHLQENIPALEPDTAIKDLYERILEEAEDVADQSYPDVDFGGADGESSADAIGIDDGMGEDEDDDDVNNQDQQEEETEEVLSQYRVTHPRVVKALRRIRPHHTDAIKEAADHLHTMAGLGEDEVTHEHKAMCHEHARALDALHGAVGGVDTSMTKGEEEEETDPSQPAGEVEKAAVVQEGEQEEESPATEEEDTEASDAGDDTDDEENEDEEEDEGGVVEKSIDYAAVAAALDRIEKVSETNGRMWFKATGIRV